MTDKENEACLKFFFEIDLIKSSYRSTSPKLLDAKGGNAELSWMASLIDKRRMGRKLRRQKKKKGRKYIFTEHNMQWVPVLCCSQLLLAHLKELIVKFLRIFQSSC